MATRTLRLYVTADGKQAVRAFEEVGAASTASADKVEASSAKERVAMDEVHKSTGRLTSGIGMLAGTAGIGGLVFGIKDVIDAGQKWQLQQSQLVNALKNTGQYSAATMKSVMDAAESLSTRGGFAGPDELTAINQFIRLTGDAHKAIQLNAAATNLARGTSLGYTQAQRMIGQVLTGNTGRLQRYLGIIQPVKTAEFQLQQAHQFNILKMDAMSKSMGTLGPLWLKEQEIIHGLTPQMIQHAQLLDRQATATEVLGRIQAKYGGATSAFSKTYAGAVSNLNHQFDILAKNIGEKLLPVLNSVIQFLSKHTTLVLVLMGALAALAVTYGVVTAAAAAWGAITTVGTVAMGAATAAAGLFDSAILILGIGFEAMGVSAAAAWVLATGGLVLLVAAVAAAVYFIITHFTQVKHFLANVWKDIMTGVHWLVGAFKAAFEAIVNLPVVKQVIGIIGDIGSFLGSNPHTARAVQHGIATRAREHKTIGPIGFGHATGGLIGGYGAGDIVPAMLEPGEFVLRREAVQNIGVQRLNSINASGHLAGQGGGEVQRLNVTMPVQLKIGNSRILAEQVVKFAATKNAMAGTYVSG